MFQARRCSITLSLFAVTTLLASPVAFAEPGERGSRRGPPQEAFDACTNGSDGQTCSFSGHRGDVQGTCIVPPRADDGRLVCAPERGNRRPREEQQVD